VKSSYQRQIGAVRSAMALPPFQFLLKTRRDGAFLLLEQLAANRE
jgi:hypothetical protein